MLEEAIKKTNLHDVLIIIIAAFAIVNFWRGTWNLLDKYLLPNNFLTSQIISILIGITILVIIARIK